MHIEMYPGKVVTLLKAKPLLSKQDCSDVKNCTLFDLYRSRVNLIEGVNLMLNPDL